MTALLAAPNDRSHVAIAMRLCEATAGPFPLGGDTKGDYRWC